MNTAPIPPVPPPCDEDYARLEAELDGASADQEPDASDQDSPETQRLLGQSTKQELRELQRIMLDVARGDMFGSAKASAARAWKELEILRMAKAGKPLTLSVTAKSEVRRASMPQPMLAIAPQDQAQAA